MAELGQRLYPDDPINIQFTSGTTGSPKGATLSHRNILNNANIVAQGMMFTPSDSLCIPVPLYHCFGMVLGTLTCLSQGATAVFPAEAFDPVSTLEALEQERCTALHGVPTMFIAELDHSDFSRFDLSSLRTGIKAGAPCPVEVMFSQLFVRHFAENSELPVEVLLDDDSQRVEVHRKPLGVVAGICPWSFPLLITMYKLAPALITGNTVIIKPAPSTIAISG